MATAAACAEAESIYDTSADYLDSERADENEYIDQETAGDMVDDEPDTDILHDQGYCTFHSDCDDGIYCNGVEICIGEECQPGEPVVCGDSITCTVDECDEGTKSCMYTPEDSLCDDGNICNGAERCTTDQGCSSIPGTAVVCSDGINCTLGECDWATGDCSYVPDDSLCSDGVFCNGEEICDPNEGCLTGVPPDCSADDAIACTIEECDENSDSCVHTPDDSLCDDEIFCNGREVCDIASGGCMVIPETCNDRNPCTIDSCNTEMDACVNILIDEDSDTYPPGSCGGPDCDDSNPEVHPAAPEICDDGIDNNCNERTDNEDYACCAGGNDTCDCPVDVSVGGIFTGDNTDAIDNYQGTCSAPDGKDRIFYFYLINDAEVELSTEGSDFDTVLFIREAACHGIEVVCDNNGGPGLTSLVHRVLTAGEYFVFLDGYSRRSDGNFQLSVNITEHFPPFPVSGNDRCIDAVDVSLGGCFTGDTTSMNDDYEPDGCGSGGGKDAVFFMNLSTPGRVHLDTNYSEINDTLLYVREGSCTGTQVECDDDGGEDRKSLIESDLPAGRYYVFIDGYSSLNEGAYRLCVSFP